MPEKRPGKDTPVRVDRGRAGRGELAGLGSQRGRGDDLSGVVYQGAEPGLDRAVRCVEDGGGRRLDEAAGPDGGGVLRPGQRNGEGDEKWRAMNGRTFCLVY